MYVCVCVFLAIYECVCCLCMRQAQEKNRVTKSITLTSQGVSLSCYKWLPERLACQGWEISHAVACKSFSANCHGSPSSIFTSLSGIGDATKSETLLGNKSPREVSLMILRGLTRIYREWGCSRTAKTRQRQGVVTLDLQVYTECQVIFDGYVNIFLFLSWYYKEIMPIWKLIESKWV